MQPTTSPKRGRPRQHPASAHDRRYVLLHLANAYQHLHAARRALHASPEVLAYLRAERSGSLHGVDMAIDVYSGAFVDLRRALQAEQAPSDD